VPTFQIASRQVAIERASVEVGLEGVLPEPIQQHYVIVHGRRFPPKQVISAVTGIDRADFTTHHARRILRRLGFVTERRRRAEATSTPPEYPELPQGGRQAAALEPYRGKWVALGEPDDVLVAADTLGEIASWLAAHEQRASGVLRVPVRPDESGGLAPR
jgi:hypothetical protein